jgi:tetratricopeptide (TPR) repeat protein
MEERKAFSPLAWVGSITAVFSLIAGIYAGWSFLAGQVERRHAVEKLLTDEAVQLRAADYQSAWKTLAQAAAMDHGSARVQQAQEEVAMEWLDHAHATGGVTFVSVVEKLAPVLTRGAASAKSPERRADLMAHLGWSYFLRGREEPSSPDPAPAYRDALAIDAANPYAHAMWGHWMLWNREDLTKASEHFAAALAAPRPALRPWVRNMQLSALKNVDTPAASQEMIRVVNQIRQDHGDLEPPWPHDILNLYWEHMIVSNEDKPAFLSVIPLTDHVDTFEWLLAQSGPEDRDSLTHAYIRSALLEAAGRRDDALESYRALQTRFPHSGESTLATRSTRGRVTRSRAWGEPTGRGRAAVAAGWPRHRR